MILSVLLVVGLLLGALRLRGRLAALPILPQPDGAPAPQHRSSPTPVLPQPDAADGAPAPQHRSSPTPVDGYRLVTAAGVVVDDDTRDTAVGYAHRHDLRVLDLVPADLAVADTYALARQVDPARYRADRMAAGRGAGHAILVEAGLAERAGLTATADLDPAEVIRLTARLKKYAATGADIVVAPRLTAVPADPATTKARLRAAGAIVSLSLTGPVIGYAVLALAVAVRPGWGLVALLVHSLQPYVVLAGTPIRPADRRRAWLRLAYEPMRWWRTVRGTWRSRYDQEQDRIREQAREEYAAELAGGTDRFFTPSRADCPWCGGRELRVRVRTTDRVQCKPGRFTLVGCDTCGHVFQNPRLSLDGLDFYYRDVYDRLGEDSTEHVFGMAEASYSGRATVVRRHTTPANWLDVGTGHGHFCAYAQGVFPETVFDGLDLSSAIDEAQRRGWVATGYRGLFPDFVEKLADSYDVVSMHHYLEHTLDPRAELDAAARVVAPGGYLLIEVPNPASRLARLLRGYWVPYFQPEHLNLLPEPNLTAALRERGLQPVDVEFGRAHQPCDFAGAALLWVNSLFPDPDRPWAARPGTRGRRLARSTAFVAAVPLLLLGHLLDRVLGAAIAATGGGNCYRVLARKPAEETA